MRLKILVLQLIVFSSFLAGAGHGFAVLPGRTHISSPFEMARPAVIGQSVGSPLANATVYDILQDEKGFVWVATSEGAYKVEGTRWIPFPLPPEARSSPVRAIEQTRDGSLWFGLETGGLWNCKGANWTVWNRENGLPGDRVNALLEASDGSLWAACSEGLARVQGGAWTVFDDGDGLPGNCCWKVRELHDFHGHPQIWTATARGVAVLRGSLFVSPGRIQGIGKDLPEDAYSDVAETIARDGTRCYWTNACHRGIYQWDGKNWILHAAVHGMRGGAFTAMTATYSPYGEPSLWVASNEEGLYHFEKGIWSRYSPAELGAGGVCSLKANPSGQPTLWIGGRGAGLLSLDMQGWRLLGQKTGLSQQEVTCVASVQDGVEGKAFWLGTGRGIFRWKDSQWSTDSKVGGLPGLRANSMYVQPDRGEGLCVWVTTAHGISCWRKGKWRHFTAIDGIPATPTWNIREILDEVGQPVIAAANEGGLLIYRAGRWTVETRENGLPHEWVTDICQTSGKQGERLTWLATRGGGIVYREKGQWIPCNKGLDGPAVSRLLITHCKNGTPYLWAATLGKGIARLNAHRIHEGWQVFDVSHYPMMLSDYFYHMEKDGGECFYGNTNRGIARFRIREVNGVPTPVVIDNFTQGDGLPTPGHLFTPHLDPDGYLWFGSLKGAIVLDTNQESSVASLPVPFLQRVLADGVEVDASGAIQFRHGQRNMIFEYFLPFHHRPEDTTYRSQIVGLERGPGPWFPENRRVIAGITPGEYVMRVWARDFRGRISDPLEIPFMVQFSPWRRTWALVLYFLAAAGGIAGFFHVRELLLKRRNAELEMLVAQRTRELERSNEGLLQLNQQHMEAIEDLNNALMEVKTLQGIIPICMECKKIRDDAGYWNQLEAYMSKHSGLKFSHGYCPECAEAALQALEEYKSQTPPIKWVW